MRMKGGRKKQYIRLLYKDNKMHIKVMIREPVHKKNVKGNKGKSTIKVYSVFH